MLNKMWLKKGKDMKKIKFLIVLILLTRSYLLQAAGPVTHAILGEMWLDKCGTRYTQNERKLFLIGTLYPDIRYLAALSREATHLSSVSLEDIEKQTDPFTAGSMFHSWVDNAREYYLKSRKSTLLPLLKGVSSMLSSNYLKWLEDEIYFPMQSFSEVAEDLKTVREGQLKGGVGDKVIREWNNILIEQLTYSPSTFFERMSKKEDGRFFELSPNTVKQWSLSLKQYAQDHTFKDYARDLLTFFEEQMSDCKSLKTYPFEAGSETPASIKYWVKLIKRLGRDQVWPYLPQAAKDYLLDAGWI